MAQQPIGVFDSGYGGLTVLKEMVRRLPQYDYLYLGDNGRAPYGNRSFETVYQYTLQCVEWLFAQGCPLVVLACNTASAKALRTIQQLDLPRIAPHNRVLGVIRPTTEVVGRYTHTGSVGVLATRGTVLSQSYPIEIAKFFPDIRVYQQACPLWVPLIENNEHDKPGSDYFVRAYTRQLMSQSGDIDTVLLGCTHFPLLKDKIAACLPPGTRIISQGEIVADSLADYLHRHPEIESRCSRNAGFVRNVGASGFGPQNNPPAPTFNDGPSDVASERDAKDGNEPLDSVEGRSSVVRFCTTDSTEDFDNHASIFYGSALHSAYVTLT